MYSVTAIVFAVWIPGHRFPVLALIASNIITFLGRSVCVQGNVKSHEPTLMKFLEGLCEAQEGYNEILVAIPIPRCILDHTGLFTIRQYETGLKLRLRCIHHFRQMFEFQKHSICYLLIFSCNLTLLMWQHVHLACKNLLQQFIFQNGFSIEPDRT